MDTMTQNPNLPTYVDPYPGRKGSERVEVPCGRCGGTGIYHGPTNARWNNGRYSDAWCFACDGSKTTTVLVSSERAAARAEVRRRIAAIEEAERFALALAVFENDGYAELVKTATELFLDMMRDGDPLKAKLRNAVEELRPLAAEPEKAADEIRAIEAEILARDAAKRSVPVGRVVIEGVILSTKPQESAYGTTWKMLVEGDGWKVWGSIPSEIFQPAEKGVRVRFTATVEPSQDDPSFGFYKRPTKAEIVA